MGSLIYFLIWGAAIFLMMRFGCGAHVMGHGHGHGHDQPDSPADGHDTSRPSGSIQAPSGKEVDPVCHMAVETAKAKSAVYGGQAYYFCSQDCRAKFEADPNTYAIAAASPSAVKEHHHAH